MIFIISSNVAFHISAAYIACLIIGVFLLRLSIKPEQVSGIINIGANTNASK